MKIRMGLLAFMLAVLPAACTPTTSAEPALPANATPTDLPAAASTFTSASTNPPTPTCTSVPDYNGILQKALPTNKTSCLPDKTEEGIGLYVYDLDNDQELVSINADVPFLFASAFKGPVLIYFLANCRKYWNTASPEWNSYFQDVKAANDIGWYASEEYRNKLVAYLSQVSDWGTIENFSVSNRASTNGNAGPLDRRYFILAQVYNMVTQSSSYAAGLVLNFVHENCLAGQSIGPIEQQCGGSNAITEFNHWFNEFSQIKYENSEPRRGLYSFDIVTTVDENGNRSDARMPTYGLVDDCVNPDVFLDCASGSSARNAWTARDLFKFYDSLFNLDDETVRSAAMGILEIDAPSISRGYLKNMARVMNAEVMSKNGYSGLVFADAGIMEYRGRFYVISTLSYNAVGSMNALYGQYDGSGNPIGVGKGLLQELIDGSLIPG
jgi:hypothetical protein